MTDETEKLVPAEGQPEPAPKEAVPGLGPIGNGFLTLTMLYPRGNAQVSVSLDGLQPKDAPDKLYILLRDAQREPMAFGVGVAKDGRTILQFVFGEPKRVKVANSVGRVLRGANGSRA